MYFIFKIFVLIFDAAVDFLVYILLPDIMYDLDPGCFSLLLLFKS